MTEDGSSLRQDFERFDRDSNGWIDEGEFGELLSSLGVSFPREKVMIAFMAIDVNGNGRIDFGEFEAWWKKRSG